VCRFINREDIDFDNVDTTSPIQEWELVPSADLGAAPDGIAEYPTRVARFGSVRNLTIYFPNNFGNPTTQLYYVGLRGEFTEISKDPVITLYEAAPNPTDHVNITGITARATDFPSH
jgi:hypothetical protein